MNWYYTPVTVVQSDTTPPAQVAGLVVNTAGNTQLNLTWTANTEADLHHYNVYRGTTAGFTVTLGTTTPVGQPTTNSFSNTGLTASTTYYYKVSAVDASGNIGPLSSERSGTTSATADTTPPAVSITSPVGGATVTRTVTVSGTASDNVNVAAVGVKIDESGAYTLATPVAPGDYSSWNVTLTNVPLGSHNFIARATDGAGNMNWYYTAVNVV